MGTNLRVFVSHGNAASVIEVFQPPAITPSTIIQAPGSINGSIFVDASGALYAAGQFSTGVLIYDPPYTQPKSVAVPFHIGPVSIVARRDGPLFVQGITLNNNFVLVYPASYGKYKPQRLRLASLGIQNMVLGNDQSVYFLECCDRANNSRIASLASPYDGPVQKIGRVSGFAVMAFADSHGKLLIVGQTNPKAHGSQPGGFIASWEPPYSRGPTQLAGIPFSPTGATMNQGRQLVITGQTMFAEYDPPYNRPRELVKPRFPRRCSFCEVWNMQFDSASNLFLLFQGSAGRTGNVPQTYGLFEYKFPYERPIWTTGAIKDPDNEPATMMAVFPY